MATDPGISGGGREVTTETRLELDAPCASCAHAAVCSLKAAIDRARTADVVLSRLPDGLTVVIRGTVECSFYDRAKGKHVVTPEGRAAMVANGRRVSASRKAAAEA